MARSSFISIQSQFSQKAKKVGVAQRRTTSSEIDCLSILAKTGEPAFSPFFHIPSNSLKPSHNSIPLPHKDLNIAESTLSCHVHANGCEKHEKGDSFRTDQENCKVRGLVHFSARKRILSGNGRPKTWTCPLRVGTLQFCAP